VRRTVETMDGRSLLVYDDGEPGGFPVVYQHGTPSCGALYEPWVTLAREQGVRLIGFDRAGYGASSRQAGRLVADVVADVTAIADALELDRFATWGISGGAPHALACAALCDERLTAAASLAAPAPYGVDSLDWWDGMGELNLIEFGAAIKGEEALRPVLEEQRAERHEPADLVESWASLLGPADQAVLTERFAAFVLDCLQQGLHDSVDGWLDDDFAFLSEWGFDLGRIDRPVLLLHGDDDRFVPVAHGRWLAAAIPGVEARIDAADGHLTLLERRLRDVNTWLLARG
jgi:pimeloyl-ACP methyl ester carboxylesterase